MIDKGNHFPRHKIVTVAREEAFFSCTSCAFFCSVAHSFAMSLLSPQSILKRDRGSDRGSVLLRSQQHHRPRGRAVHSGQRCQRVGGGPGEKVCVRRISLHVALVATTGKEHIWETLPLRFSPKMSSPTSCHSPDTIESEEMKEKPVFNVRVLIICRRVAHDHAAGERSTHLDAIGDSRVLPFVRLDAELLCCFVYQDGCYFQKILQAWRCSGIKSGYDLRHVRLFAILACGHAVSFMTSYVRPQCIFFLPVSDLFRALKSGSR